jgi:hypothetical protein
MKISDISTTKDEYNYPMRVRHALLKPDDIPSLIAYYTLRELFGPPNGEIDKLKSQWGYYLRVPGAYLGIYDWKLESWSIAVYEDSNVDIGRELLELEKSGATKEVINQRFSELTQNIDWVKAEKIGNAFLGLLRKHAQKFNSQANKAAADAKSFVLQNPYVLYSSSAVNLLEKARDSPADARDYYRSAFFLFIAAFEGLLNLIYELYAKSELRDDRVFERLSREQIDIKVRLAPLYCDCFSERLIDHTAEIFRRFHTIVNLRNDFIHANFTKPMKRSIIVEDDYTFILRHASRDKYGLPKAIDDLSQNDLTLIKESMAEMTDLLIHNMKPRYRHEFRRIIEEEYIQITIEDGDIIIVSTQ